MGRPKKYVIQLTDAERELLSSRRRSRKINITIKKRIQIILAMDLNGTNPLTRGNCAKKFKTSPSTVSNTCALFCKEGIEGLLKIKRNENSNHTRQVFDGEDEAKIIAMACSDAPDGREKWTVRLIADMISLEHSISKSTVQRILKKNQLRPHMNEYWCIPEEQSADFVAHMEDILEVYQRRVDPDYPVWCLDEKPYQLLGESREPIPMKPGFNKKIDAEYVRNGHVSIFCMINPNTGQIHQSVQPSRTAIDFAHQVKWLVDVAEPNAKKIVLVMDNLNTHRISSLYKAFPAPEAARIAQKLEIHYTPVHGSWLDIAEIAINIISRQCLGKRYETIDLLRECLDKWETARNEKEIAINWKFTCDDARQKLHRLYPTFTE